MALLGWVAVANRLIISDVDGTITRSDILGHVLPRVGLDWSHYGINRLFTNIRANGYEIMFLSSRAIAQVVLPSFCPLFPWLNHLHLQNVHDELSSF
jgi:phosphatidate phosphatase PAH1